MSHSFLSATLPKNKRVFFFAFLVFRKPTKVSFGYIQLADGELSKVRYARRSGNVIERPLSLSRAHGKGHTGSSFFFLLVA